MVDMNSMIEPQIDDLDNKSAQPHLKPLAVFDLDNTLLDGESDLIWGNFLLSRKLVKPDFMKKIQQYLVEYAAGTVDYFAYGKYLLMPVLGLTSHELQLLMDDFIKTFPPIVRPQLTQRIEYHRLHGFTILLVTATVSLLAKPIASLLGIEHLICTIAGMQDGKPVGGLVDLPALGQEKVTKVRTWIKSQPVTLEGSWGYSDSYTDLPILQLVQNPVAVSPDEKLREHAMENGWQIIEGNG
jgi:HAD superfamily hydrolase (TIGR01490 family)